MSNDFILKNVSNLEEYLIFTRRYLHENPEVSHKEYQTSTFLKQEIKKLEFEIIETPGTGFIAILDTGKEGKTVALRTDIDALPIQENVMNLRKKKVSVSKNDGAMHACAHDGHMAIILAAAKILNEMKDLLAGKIIFMFEESEEAGGGAEQLIEILKNYKIDAIYGNHLVSFIEAGKISVDAGPVMAGAILVDFKVIGKGGHGSRPDLSISPIFGSANVLTALASAWSNQIDVTKTVTLGLGSINGGTVFNVIPDEVKITGSLRFYDSEEGKKAINIMKTTSKHAAMSQNCSVEFTEGANQIAVHPVINDIKLSKIARDGINEILPGVLTQGVKWFASESFSKYNCLAPIVFAFVGIKNLEEGMGAEHHNEFFDMDEKALYYGTAAQVKFVYDYLRG